MQASLKITSSLPQMDKSCTISFCRNPNCILFMWHTCIWLYMSSHTQDFLLSLSAIVRGAVTSNVKPHKMAVPFPVGDLKKAVSPVVLSCLIH